MVTFALLGTKAGLADKLAFDPDRSKRRVMYAEVCKTFPDYVVYIGGSSSFDLAPARYNKYDAMCAYGAARGIGVEEMIFVGDDFDDGGGDSHIRLRGMDYVRRRRFPHPPAGDGLRAHRRLSHRARNPSAHILIENLQKNRIVCTFAPALRDRA